MGSLDAWMVAVDEAWIEEAVERYQRVERLLADFDKAVASIDVSVSSPDGLVEVVVAADGTIREVTISESAVGRPARELSKAVHTAVTAAAQAAAWARTKLQQDMFGQFPQLPDDPGSKR